PAFRRFCKRYSANHFMRPPALPCERGRCWARLKRALRALRLRQLDANIQLAELAVIHHRRGTREEIGGLLRLGKRDHVADVIAAGKEHDPPVEAEGNAAVRRSTVAQGFQQKAEPLLGFFRWNPEQIENLLLDGRVVNTNRTAGALAAIDHEV